VSQFRAALLSNDDESAWSALWRRSGRLLSQHWRWAEWAAQGVGRPIRAGVYSGSGELLAGIAFVERMRGGLLRQWANPAPAPFGGLLCSSEAGGESFSRDVLLAMEETLVSESHRAEIVFQPGFEDLRALAWQGWRIRPYYNYTSRIDAPDALEQQAENAARRQGRKARASGYQIVEGKDLVEELVDLWEVTRRRQGLPSHVSPEAFHRIAAEAGEEEDFAVKLVGVRHPASGNLEAAGLFAADGQRVYYLLGASRLDGGKEGTGAPTLLHFEATRRFFEERGDCLYDWVGANSRSVAQFKKKFRPRLELCLRAFGGRGVGRWNWG